MRKQSFLCILVAIAIHSYSNSTWAQSASERCKNEQGVAKLTACNDAIRENQSDWLSYAHRSVYWYSVKEYDASIADVNVVIRLNPNYSWAYNQRGIAWVNKQDNDRAISDFNEAIRLNPIFTQAYKNRGNVWRGKGNHDQAIVDYTEAIRLNPSDASNFNGRGISWFAKKDYDRSIADYDEAIRLDPNNGLIYFNRGLNWRAKQDNDRAISDFNDAIRLNPRHANSFGSRGSVYAIKKDYDRSIADYAEAIRLDSSNATHYAGRGFAWQNKGDNDRAISDLNEAIRLNPKNPVDYYNRGIAWARKSDHDRALSDFDEAIKLNPNYANAYNSRGFSWFQKNDYDRAIANYAEAIRLEPTLAIAHENRRKAEATKAALIQGSNAPNSSGVRDQESIGRDELDLKRVQAQLAADSTQANTIALSHRPQQKEARIALVIGNSAYKQAPLRNPTNDARDMAAKLRSLGFTVIERSNLGIRQIGSTLREFRAKLTPGSVALVFYAGHGLQIKGENYLPAVDADISGEEDVPNQSLAIRQIMDVLSDAKTRLNLVFLDACRDNPYARSFRSASRGLSKENAPSGTLISYATRPGSVAADGSGRNGVYTGALLAAMNESNRPIEQVLKSVVTAVKTQSRNQQEPWIEGSIEGEFCFGACVSEEKTQLAAAPDPLAVELAFWDSIKNSNNLDDFRAYLSQYSEGKFSALARNRLDAQRPSVDRQPSTPSPSAGGSVSVETKSDVGILKSMLESGSSNQLYAYAIDSKSGDNRADVVRRILELNKENYPVSFYFDTSTETNEIWFLMPKSIALWEKNRIGVSAIKKKIQNFLLFKSTDEEVLNFVLNCNDKSFGVSSSSKIENGVTKASEFIGVPSLISLSPYPDGSVVQHLEAFLCEPNGMIRVANSSDIEISGWQPAYKMNENTMVYFNKKFISKYKNSSEVVLITKYEQGLRVSNIEDLVYVVAQRFRLNCGERVTQIDSEMLSKTLALVAKFNPYGKARIQKIREKTTGELAFNLGCVGG